MKRKVNHRPIINSKRLDIIMKEYEINEKYHDQKENKAWIVSAFYITSFIVVLNNQNIEIFLCLLNDTFIFISILIFTLSFDLIIAFQIRLKNRSNAISNILQIIINDLLLKQDESVIWIMDSVKRKKWQLIPKSDIILLGVIYLFTVFINVLSLRRMIGSYNVCWIVIISSIIFLLNSPFILINKNKIREGFF